MSSKTWQKVLISLRQIIRATDMHSKNVMRRYGLTIPQLVVLRAIDNTSNVTVRTISEHVSLSQATVTTILNRLEQRGLVIRKRSADDRRIVHTVLTDAARRIIETSPPLLHEDFVRRFEALDEWEQSSILSALQRVANMMGAEKLEVAPMLKIDDDDKLDDVK
jgi:DNA-binding MarR family transcriptional regulator